MSTNSEFFLFVLFVILFRGLIIGQAHKTGTCHLIPPGDKLIFANNIHSADPNSTSEFHNVLRRTSRSKENLIANKKLVILPYFHSSFYSLPDEIVTLYKDNLIPAAIHYWENSLSLKYPHSPLYLGRFCNPSQSYYSETKKTHICESDCGETTKCGDYIPIPEEHLEVCQECKRDEKSCKEKGKRHKGVNADFILYISSVHSEHCESSNTVAYSAYCQLESKYNRPVAGYTNICPNLVSTKKSAIQEALATLKHEILHPLGFSLGLFAFFIDKNGKSLTPRDPKTGKPPFNKLTNMHEPSEKVLKTIVRKDWKIGSGYVNRNVTLLVTPRVVSEVRNHFNCSSLEGAELENQGEMGTKLTHWEKRIFEQEAMTGASTHNSVFSRITFALLEDTGWYNVNYSNAEEIKFGRNLGCEFAQKSCKDWIDSRSARNQSIRPYCNQISDSHHRYETPKYECDDRKEAVMLCNLVKHKHALPSEYQNFNASDHVEFTRRHAEKNGEKEAHAAVNHLGGSVELADYCPLMQQVSWTVADGTRDSKCTIDENQPTENTKNYNLEVYGSQSKCFLHEREWSIYTDRCQSKLSLTKTVGCYEYSCDPEQGLVVKIHDQYVKCSTKDEVIDFKVATAKYLKTTSIYYGNIICPSCEEICQNKIDCSKFREKSTTTSPIKKSKNISWTWLQNKINMFEEQKMCSDHLKQHHPVESKSSEIAEFRFSTLFSSLIIIHMLIRIY